MEKKVKNIQIGVIGSMMEQKVSQIAIKAAKKVGQEIAKQKACLLFGFEPDQNSLSLIAAEKAVSGGATALAFLIEKSKKLPGSFPCLKVVTGQSRGGGREFGFILSTDAIVAIGGGSGTLTEIAIAYQADIPVVAVAKTGGWSNMLAGKFLDKRKREKIFLANTPVAAVKLAINLAKRKQGN